MFQVEIYPAPSTNLPTINYQRMSEKGYLGWIVDLNPPKSPLKRGTLNPISLKKAQGLFLKELTFQISPQLLTQITQFHHLIC
jgi:hypothetical protein